MSIKEIDQIILERMRLLGEPAARVSLFIIFFSAFSNLWVFLPRDRL